MGKNGQSKQRWKVYRELTNTKYSLSMKSGIRIIYPSRLNEEFNSKFQGYQV